MLKANPKIWAIVIAICLVGQFLAANILNWFGSEVSNAENVRIKNVQMAED